MNTINDGSTPEPMYEEIWLQCPNLDSMSEWYGEVTWCKDQQNDDDIKYVRADLFASIEKQRDELLAALTLIASGEAENGSILSSGECQRIAYDAIVSVMGEQ